MYTEEQLQVHHVKVDLGIEPVFEDEVEVTKKLRSVFDDLMPNTNTYDKLDSSAKPHHILHYGKVWDQ